MKKGALLLCWLSLFLFLSSVQSTSYKTLNNFKDLKSTSFGRHYPRHGLMLLHWFSNNVNVDQNNVIQLFNIRPNRGDYGFHRYRNDSVTGRHLFPTIPNSTYYTFGNLNNRHVQSEFPVYVSHDFLNSRGYSLRNVDRLVIRVQEADPQKVQEVFISQHYEDQNRGSGYDPDNTHRLSPALLREILNLFGKEDSDPHIGGLYPHTRGLTPLMTEAGYDVNDRVIQFRHSRFCKKGTNHNNHNHYHSQSLSTNLKCDLPNKIKLFVESTSNGYAKISWSEVPENFVRKNSKVALYKDDQLMTAEPMDGRTYGTIATKTALNPGLQVKLLTAKHDIIWEGPEFNEANGAIPTDISGYDASLQLFTKDGYASARLFINKTFTDWKDTFYNSWVGFYRESGDCESQYKTYQWAVKFEKKANQEISEHYDIYEYKSRMALGPGVNLRFMLDKGYSNEGAHTKPWDGNNPINDESQKK